MKIKSLLIGMLACTALVGCTNDEDVLDNNQQEVAKGQKNYLAISIKNTSTGSRAAEDGGYESGYDGSAEEGQVKSIRFYLFLNGQPRNVTASDNNYLDVTVNTDPSQADFDTDNVAEGKPMATEGNVESMVDAVLVINGEKASLPNQIVAIANPKRASLGDANKSLAELTNIAGAYDIYNYKKTNEENPFLMSNSVYNNTDEIVATSIPDNAYQTTAALAMSNPVDIYIERVVAKVRVKFNTTNFTPDVKGEYYQAEVKDADQNQVTYNGKKVYTRIYGWGITNIKPQSYLFKDLSTQYTFPNGNWAWNDPNNFRSYWANTYATNNENINNWSWNEGERNLKGQFEDQYCLENTTGDYTQVLLAAQMVDEDGEALTIFKYGGQDVTEDAYKQIVVSSAAIYKKDNGTLKKLSKNDIELTYEDQSTSTRYKAIPKLVATEGAFYSGLDADGKEVAYESIDEVNTYLANDNYAAQVWNSGMGYYYLDIEHLGGATETPNYGVVRNHIYEITINDVHSLGTPVFEDNLVIIPEKPDPDTSKYLSAQIKVLSWHVVKQSVEL